MSKSVVTPFDQNGDALPIVDLQFESGLHLAATRDEAISTGELPAGVYQIRATADVFLSIGSDPAASDAAGSTFLSAGIPDHHVIRESDRISARGANSSASVFIIRARSY